MSKYENILVKMFKDPVTKLRRSNKKPPNREVLRLYREVMKFCAEFDFPNEQGVSWKVVLRKSAREEFEASREENDPVMLYKMIITTKDAMTQTREMLIAQYNYLHQHIPQNDVLQKRKSELGRVHDYDMNDAIHDHLYGSLKEND